MADKAITVEGEKKDWIDWAGLIIGYTIGGVIFIAWLAWSIFWPLLRLVVEFLSFFIVGVLGAFLGGRR